MKQNQTKMIFMRDCQRGEYTGIGPDYSDDELLILEELFSSFIGGDPTSVFKRRRWMEGDNVCVGGNLLGSYVIDGKIHIYHDYVPNLKEPVLTKEELLALVDRWLQLVAVKTERIVITNDDGKFSIGAE